MEPRQWSQGSGAEALPWSHVPPCTEPSCASYSTVPHRPTLTARPLTSPGQLKSAVQRHKGHLDYHGLECESLLSFLQNKFALLAEPAEGR